MRILVLSDIHANQEALDACLQAAPTYDQVFNLGDIVGYGANPNEVIEKVRKLGKVFVRGNHDRACSGMISLEGFNSNAGMAALWTHNHLSDENLEFLRQLPKGPLHGTEHVTLVHGSARDEDEYVLVLHDAQPLLSETNTPLTFFGHTHIQCGFSEENHHRWQTLMPIYRSVTGVQHFMFHLRPGARYLINPGSVGQPRDNDPRAAFLLYDMDEGSITFYRVPYNISAAQKKIHSAGLPERLAERLAEGR
ncbi:MAG TPA: metallophosphoesterase family protein [Candidatus Angelobacter sp.]|nr:metallophosphoesterase family protein [Candidatus Angelobacter sp.]